MRTVGKNEKTFHNMDFQTFSKLGKFLNFYLYLRCVNSTGPSVIFGNVVDTLAIIYVQAMSCCCLIILILEAHVWSQFTDFANPEVAKVGIGLFFEKGPIENFFLRITS